MKKLLDELLLQLEDQSQYDLYAELTDASIHYRDMLESVSREQRELLERLELRAKERWTELRTEYARAHIGQVYLLKRLYLDPENWVWQRSEIYMKERLSGRSEEQIFKAVKHGVPWDLLVLRAKRKK